MNYKFNGVIYQQNGLKVKTELPYTPTDSFDIYEYYDNPLSFYNYPGDSLLLQIETEVIALRDKIRRLYFPSDDEYYHYSKVIPIFATSVGYDSDITMLKTNYESLIAKYFSLYEKHNPEEKDFHQIINKYMYLTDAQYILGSIQNIIIGAMENFVNYFRLISCVDYIGHDVKNSIYTITSGKTYQISSVLGDYFTKLHSILDLLTKVAYELEHPINRFDKYMKLTSHSILYEKQACISLNNRIGTVFYKDSLINAVSTIRNEIIHNGSWEDIPKVYLNIENKTIIERFMLFPDIEENGNLSTFVNRKHFYGSGIKVNDILPSIHITFMNRILRTMVLLNHKNMTDDELKDYLKKSGIPIEVIEMYKWK